MRETTPGCPNFLNKQDSQFRQLQGTLDALFHKLHSDGIGVQVRHTEIITKQTRKSCGQVVSWVLVIQDHYKMLHSLW